MAGFEVSKSRVDQRIGSSVLRLRDAFDDIERTAAWVAARGDAGLEALTYSSQEADDIVAAFLALEKLRQVAYGLETQAVADNFFFHGNKLTGVE